MVFRCLWGCCKMQLAQIKAQFTIKQALDIYLPTLSLKKQGDKLVGMCPFHDDRSPSFTIRLDKNRFKCFGCNVGGDQLDLVALALNLPLREALKVIADDLGISNNKASPELKKKLLKEQQEREKNRLFNTEIDRIYDEISFYCRVLGRSSVGIEDPKIRLWIEEKFPLLEHLAECLRTGGDHEKIEAMKLFKNFKERLLSDE